MFEVLIPYCSKKNENIEECATNLYSNFGLMVMPIMKPVMADFVHTFPESKIFLLGSSEKILKTTIFNTKRKRPLSNDEEKTLVKFASALAIAMNISLPFSVKKVPLHYEEIFARIEKKNDNTKAAQESKTPGYTFIEFDLNSLIQSHNANAVYSQVMRDDFFQPTPNSILNTKQLFGVNFSELIYDEESGVIIRNLFGSPLPRGEIRKKRNCISPDHKDSVPSMDLILKPLIWRNSPKTMRFISKEQDRALEEMCISGKSNTIEKRGDNAAMINNSTVLLYLCFAHCYSTKCNFSSYLSNSLIPLSDN